MSSIDAAARQARLDSLTGLRFFAAFVVLLRHTIPEIFPAPILAEVSAVGPVGVGLFFVLSGFILTWNWRPNTGTKRFYIRRAARILPLHVLTTVVAAGLLILADTPLWASTLASLFLLQAWLTEPYRLGGNSPSWSLSVEAFFYALFPFIVRPLMRVTPRWSWVIIVVCVVFMVAWTGGYFFAVKASVPFVSAFSGYTNPVFRLGEFVIGIALAQAMRQGWRPRFTVTTAAWVACGGYAALAALNAGVAHSVIRLGDASGLPLSLLDLMYLPFTVMLIACAASSDLRGDRSIFRNVYLVRLGEWSFALYLIQAIVITLAVRLVPVSGLSWEGLVLAIGVILLSIALSGALFQWFEKPAEKALRLRFARTVDLQAGTAFANRAN